VSALTALDPRLVRRARADQIAILFAQWGRTTSSMTLGGLILCAVMWNVAPRGELVLWLGAILLNQAWRYVLTRRYRAAAGGSRALGPRVGDRLDHRRGAVGRGRCALVRTG